MKTSKYGIYMIIPLLLINYHLRAQSIGLYTIGNDYTITIKGSSNLHDWSETIENTNGKSIITQNKNGSINLDSLTISMDVRSINSSEGKIMINKTLNALKAEQYPFITFSLGLPLKMIPSNASGTIINTTGRLTIAGVTRQIRISGKIYRYSSNKFIFEGSQPVQMSDYNITPPTAMLGLLKVRNQITVQYRTSFEIRNPSKT
ncbi:MAG TPA: YceI family protein [Arachidicoccus sp.]